jgi:hypothetical protein
MGRGSRKRSAAWRAASASNSFNMQGADSFTNAVGEDEDEAKELYLGYSVPAADKSRLEKP